MPQPIPGRRRGGKLLVAVVGAFVLLAGSGIALYVLVVRVPLDLAHATAEGIRTVFNFTPRVTINQAVVIEQNTPILEVATVSRAAYVDHSWSHTWLGSTKTIQVQGSFTAKAGFDLREPFSIAVERSPLKVVAAMPAPRLLSLELDSYRIVRDESGWWNRISDADRESAVRDLKELARAKVVASGILEEARATAELRIREIVERNGATVEFPPPVLEMPAER
jgi:hypothetical protein